MSKAILYEIVNSVNGLRYIGVTTTKLKERWNCHIYKLRHGKGTKRFQLDFDTYGEKSFYINELCSGTLENILLMEKEITKETVLNGYNVIVGGGGVEERRQSSMFFKEKLKNNPDYAKYIYKKIGDSRRGRKMSADAILKMSLSRKGRKWKQEHKENRSVAYSGVNNPNAGNYKMYLNLETGIYYSSQDLVFLLNRSIHSIRALFQKKHKIVNDFIKV